jgi:DNA-binding response OmpR family regulator
MYQSLTQSLKIITEAHASQAAFTPPYDLLREDIRGLAQTLEMNRLVIDALQLAALLIVPTKTSVATKNLVSSPEDDFAGIDWQRTFGQAKFIQFPWPVENALRAFREILSERVNLKELAARDPEMALAAQIMAIVWYHFYGVSREPIHSDSYALTVKTELRKKSSLLARSEVIEAYLRLIERSSEDLRATAYYQLFIVGKNDHNLMQFATRLRHLGYHPIHIGSLEEAARMTERQPPTAIFIHEPSFPKEMLICSSLFKKKESVSLYAITIENDPSKVLNLFDAGFDDVFLFPHNMDIVAARLRKTTKEAQKPGRPGSFQAAFSAFSLTDLLQGLSQGLKSVKVDLVRSNGTKATIYLNRGQLEHAACGEFRGPEAIYEVITWLDDGEFFVEPAEEFPEQNIAMPLESVLMEGCRILDESNA